MAKQVIKIGRSGRYVTPEGRLSYPNVLEPTSYQGNDPKYSCSILLDKQDDGTEETIAKLEELQEEATAIIYPDKKPRNFERWGIVDGDELDDENMHGHWIIKASNKAKPAVVDADKNEILDGNEVYGGCFGRINIAGKAYGNKTQGGVTFELLACQVTKDGPAFGGAQAAIQAAKDEF
jgi:hypothetical protein